MKELIRFQIDRELDKKDYDAINEHASIFAELMESIGLDVPKEKRPELKLFLQKIVCTLVDREIAVKKFDETPIEEQVDAYADVITFAVGAILKLGYDPIKVIEECGKVINSREGSMVDSKFEKDMSEEAQAKWHKADYSTAQLDCSEKDSDGKDIDNGNN